MPNILLPEIDFRIISSNDLKYDLGVECNNLIHWDIVSSRSDSSPIKPMRKPLHLSPSSFRTHQSGEWNNVNTWEQFEGSSWITPALKIPDSTDGAISIRNGHTVIVTVSIRIDQTIIDSGGTVVINANPVVFGIANGDDGVDLIVDGRLKVTGTASADPGPYSVDLTPGATMSVGSDGVYEHNQDGGAIPSAQWMTGSTCEITGIVSDEPANRNQNFYNVVWNCQLQAANLYMGWNGNIIGGNVTCINSGSPTSYQFRLTNAVTGETRSLSIMGDVVVTGGMCTSIGSVNGLSRVEIHHYGNIITTGGNFSVCRGSQSSGGSGTLVWYLHNGDVFLSDCVTGNSNPSGARFEFCKFGVQSLHLENVLFTGSGTNITVAGGASLDMGASVLPSSDSGSFQLMPGATLLSGHPDGIDGTIQCTGTKGGGNILHNEANYEFKGSVAQVTGLSLPDTVHNLRIYNSSGVQLSRLTYVEGTLILLDGKLKLGSSTILANELNGGSQTAYVVTDNIGVLTIKNVGSFDQLFPIGTESSYNPIKINNDGIVDDYSVRVLSTIDNQPTFPYVNREWIINENIPGGSIVSLTLQWNSVEEESVFDRNGGIGIYRLDGSSWLGKLAQISGSDPYQAKAINITKFSPFLVGMLDGSGSISSYVYHDIDGNGLLDGVDSMLAGWKIILKNSYGVVVDTQMTNSEGLYKFSSLILGTYTLSEIQDTGWIQTLPTGLGSYTVTVSDSEAITGKDFGNTRTYRFIRPTAGYWSDSANWTGGIPPGPDKFVSIPTGIVVTVDSLPHDTVKAVRIENGGTLQFTPDVSKLNVLNTLQIDDGAVLEFPENSDTTGIICYRDWVNRGTLDPGHSIIRFAGDQPKLIASDGGDNTFYRIEIAGDSTSVIGNMTVKGQLMLPKGISTRELDSIFVENDDTSAISDTGIVTQGTIERSIKLGETGAYRFESPGTYIKFTGAGTNPTSVSMTVVSYPGEGDFYWDSLGGTIDPLRKSIVIDPIARIDSRWPIGIPRPRVVNSIADSLFCKLESINRMYSIHPENGDNYNAKVSLRYDPAELSMMTSAGRGLSSMSGSESDLQIFRGPYYADSVAPRWNMISLPLSPRLTTNKDSLFPTSISEAFVYDGTYIERTGLSFTEGYWMKFGEPQQLIIQGDDIDSATIAVKEGWNLIGSISYPIDAAAVTSVPTAIIESEFFEYTTAYQPADSLMPFKGYWVKTNTTGLLLLKATRNGTMIKRNSSVLLSRLNSIKILDAKKNEAKLYFGIGKDINAALCAMPPVPPYGMYDVRYQTGRMVAVVNGVEDEIVPIMITGAKFPITLSWMKTEPLLDASFIIDGKVIEMDADGEVTVRNDSSQVFLRFGSKNTAEKAKEYQLEQNYPNPFNPVTTIGYYLPVEARVTLKIFNVLGQEVLTLVNEIQNSGQKTVLWNSDNFASGIYFYRFAASGVADPGKSLTQIKKMILLH